MEQRVCKVCAHTYDTGNLLLDQRLRNQFDMHTVTGWGLCPDHQKLFNDGYLAMVAIDESRSRKGANGLVAPEGAHRLGAIAHVRQEVAEKIFNVPLKSEDGSRFELVFVEPEVIDHLRTLMPSNDDAEQNEDSGSS